MSYGELKSGLLTSKLKFSFDCTVLTLFSQLSLKPLCLNIVYFFLLNIVLPFFFASILFFLLITATSLNNQHTHPRHFPIIHINPNRLHPSLHLYPFPNPHPSPLNKTIFLKIPPGLFVPLSQSSSFCMSQYHENLVDNSL